MPDLAAGAMTAYRPLGGMGGDGSEKARLYVFTESYREMQAFIVGYYYS